MKPAIPIIILSVIAIASFGFAFAETFSAVTSNGPLTVNNGGFTFERTDNKQTSMVLRNNDKQTAFSFIDEDDLQTYLLRSTPGTDGRLDFLDFSGASPTTRVDLSIEKSTGNIAIGHFTPTEQLDVAGNIKLSGDITGASGMTINPNGDLCLGSGCP